MYETIQVRFEDSVCFLTIDRKEANNTINGQLVAECSEVLSQCERDITIVVLNGSPEVFCFGADFKAIATKDRADLGQAEEYDQGPMPLYNLWLRMATGPYITISQVRGKANAGGVGFVAASDIVLADESAQFSLSELLFGLYPACVLPFLIRRVGVQKAHYLTLMTQSISVREAHAWGLVDAFELSSDALLRRHLVRLRRLAKPAIRNYKIYLNRIAGPLQDMRSLAIASNEEFFSDSVNLEGIRRYVERGLFPWEKTTHGGTR